MEEIKIGGVLPEIEPMRMYDYDIVCGSQIGAQSTKYPEEFMIDVKRLGVVKNQGAVGACVACVMSSLAEVFETMEQTEGKELSEEEYYNVSKEQEFSEGWAYGGLRNSNERGWGMYTSSALNNWSKKGMVKKKYFNLLAEAPEIIDIVNNFPELVEKAKPYKIKGYASISYADRSRKDLAIKEALTKNNYGLLAVSYEYFREPHCIMIVGWNDKKDKYKIKNSWGKTYGNNGIAEIPKSAINQVFVLLDEEIVPPFTDVTKEDWFYKEVKNTYFAGLLKGISNTEFAPLRNSTRGEVATIVERIIKLTLERIELSLKVGQVKKTINIEAIMNEIEKFENTDMPFIDVATDAWYYSTIKYCYNLGLIKGVTEDRYEPESYITRAEIATLCVRICEFIIEALQIALKACNKLAVSQRDKLSKVINTNKPDYLDVNKTDWFADMVVKVYQYGIMEGVSPNVFEPTRFVNRAEIAVIINRLTKFLDTKNNLLVEIF